MTDTAIDTEQKCQCGGNHQCKPQKSQSDTCGCGGHHNSEAPAPEPHKSTCACGGHHETPAAEGQAVPTAGCKCSGLKKYRKLHSLCGVLFAAFVLFHLIIIATAWAPNSFAHNTAVLDLFSKQFAWLEILFILIPLLGLFLTGLYVLYQAGLKYQVNKCNRGSKMRFFLQRMSAVFLVAFLFLHFATFSWWGLHSVQQVVHSPNLSAYDQGSLFDANSPLASTAGGMRHPFAWMGQSSLTAGFMNMVYLLGIGALVYHFANGLWTGAIVWGFCETNEAKKTWNKYCTAIGISFALLGILAWLAVVRI